MKRQVSRRRHSIEQQPNPCLGAKGAKIWGFRKIFRGWTSNSPENKGLLGVRTGKRRWTSKTLPLLPPDGKCPQEDERQETEGPETGTTKAPDTATAKVEKHDRASDNMEKSVSGPAAREPSATESEILPLHKSAIYAKDFVLRRPSGGSQLREGRIPCQDIPLSG